MLACLEVFFFQVQLKSLDLKSNFLSPGDSHTLCSAGDPLDEKRNTIDRSIARLEESIRALKSRRNELSPISRLPVEILCNIFKFSEGRARRPDSWTNYSQVSQHWRTSALNAPELWTNIPLDYPRWAQEMLIRSKMANLTIRSKPSLKESAIETVKSCLYEMKRVEKIDFTAIPVFMLEEIFRDFPKSAPQLHTLCIRPHATGPAFSIDDDLLYDTENLRRVELINCVINWDSRLLTGLTRLNLQVSLKANSSIIQVLQALQRMPALTNLDLEDSIPNDLAGLLTYPVVDLPCLRALNVSSGVHALTTFLRHITFPNSALLNLTCEGKRSTQIDFPSFFSVLVTKFLSTLVIRSLSLRDLNYEQTHGFKFYLWTTASIQECFPFSQILPTQLQLVMTWPSSHFPSHDKALTCAFDAMGLPFLTQLQIFGLDYIDSQTWVKTFGKLPLLERVCLQSSAQSSFLEALVYKSNAAEKSKTAYLNVSFPKLRHLHLGEANFFNSSIDMLLDCLMERCERNAEIHTLRLDECSYLSADDVALLEEIVVDVDWDEIEQGFSGSDEDSEEHHSVGNARDIYDDDDVDDDSEVDWTPSASGLEIFW